MAKPTDDKPSEEEPIDSTLDSVLVSALRRNFEIKSGHHIDRNEILDFLRSVIQEHPELNFVLQHRDTKLSSRIYKAFPKVTTKRVAVPSARGKKTWTYTNLRRITDTKGKGSAQPKQDVPTKKSQILKASKSEQKRAVATAEPSVQSSKRERKHFRSKTSLQSVSMVHRDSLFDNYRCERDSGPKNSRNVSNVPQQSYLGRFNDMLKWVKEHYILDMNSSVQVKNIVENIKTEFKINITYKQSHKLIFAVFPGTTSRVDHPVKIEAQGGFYSYKGIAAIKQPEALQKEVHVGTEVNQNSTSESPSVTTSTSSKPAAVQPRSSSENGRKRIFRTRKRFIEACAVLKPAEEALASRARYDAQPISSDIVPAAPEVSARFSDNSPRPYDVSSRISDVSPKFSDASSRISEVSPRCSEVSPALSNVSPRISEITPRLGNFSPRLPDMSPRFYEVPSIVSDEFRRCESNWQRLYEELKQERDQAILERNQAMVSLMEIEREQTARTPDDISRRQTTSSEVEPSSKRVAPKSEGRENPDWLRSLINRSNSILGEQMSEVNSVYFPRSTLQSNSCDQRHPKQVAYQSEDYHDFERYEQLKQERDTLWKNWIDKLTAEKDDIIQQLKLGKMEVIQRMELEKSDAVECIEEKLTNQITILTREMRELKELLNHTMNERTLAIEHAHKLMEIVGEEKLKQAGLENFPFDVTKDVVIHPPKPKTADETASQKTLSGFGNKGNKRKQSMPAKLKKIPRLDSSVSPLAEKHDHNCVPENSSQTVSTNSKNLLADTQSSSLKPVADSSENERIDNEPENNRIIDDGVVDKIDSVSTDEIDVSTNAIDTVECAKICIAQVGNRATDQSMIDSTTPGALTGFLTPVNDLTSSNAENAELERVSPKSQQTNNSSINVIDSENVFSSKKLESSKTKDSNANISQNSENTFVSSHSEDGSPAVDNTESTNSENCDSGCPGNSNTSESSEELAPEISKTLNSGTSSNHRNSDASLKLAPTTNCGDILAGASIATTTTDNNNNLGKFEYLPPTNTEKYFSKTSMPYSPFTPHSGKCIDTVLHSENSNFLKYTSEIPGIAPDVSSNTDTQKCRNPGISNSGAVLLSKESTKSFEESVNSTFMKYLPEEPTKPLTMDTVKHFNDTPRAICTNSQKYIQDHGNEALVYSNKESKVSSIDFLSSMVENIGKSSTE